MEHSLMALWVLSAYLGLASTLARLHNMPQSLSQRSTLCVENQLKSLLDPPEAVPAPLLFSSWWISPPFHLFLLFFSPLFFIIKSQQLTGLWPVTTVINSKTNFPLRPKTQQRISAIIVEEREGGGQRNEKQGRLCKICKRNKTLSHCCKAFTICSLF